jgi:hypothetical protein
VRRRRQGPAPRIGPQTPQRHSETGSRPHRPADDWDREMNSGQTQAVAPTQSRASTATTHLYRTNIRNRSIAYLALCRSLLAFSFSREEAAIISSTWNLEAHSRKLESCHVMVVVRIMLCDSRRDGSAEDGSATLLIVFCRAASPRETSQE